jgi:putative transposase
VKFAFIDAQKASHPVRALCRALGVSASGYYAWMGRAPSARARQNDLLVLHIRAVHRASRGTYGSPRVHRQLRTEGIVSGRHRVARLMRQHRIIALRRPRFRCTTQSDPTAAAAPNVLARQFTVEAPDRVWAGDITYVWTWEGWLYLAVVVDLFSRRVLGWAADLHMRTELVVDALSMALRRRPIPAGLLHHSDRGCQYTSHRYQHLLAKHGIASSMSRVGDCYDNAVVESFFGTLKTELIDRSPWPTRQAARAAIADYIDGFYNPRRLHSHLGYLSPVDFERRYRQDRASQAA